MHGWSRYAFRGFAVAIPGISDQLLRSLRADCSEALFYSRQLPPACKRGLSYPASLGRWDYFDSSKGIERLVLLEVNLDTATETPTQTSRYDGMINTPFVARSYNSYLTHIRSLYGEFFELHNDYQIGLVLLDGELVRLILVGKRGVPRFGCGCAGPALLRSLRCLCAVAMPPPGQSGPVLIHLTQPGWRTLHCAWHNAH